MLCEMCEVSPRSAVQRSAVLDADMRSPVVFRLASPATLDMSDPSNDVIFHAKKANYAKRLDAVHGILALFDQGILMLPVTSVQLNVTRSPVAQLERCKTRLPALRTSLESTREGLEGNLGIEHWIHSKYEPFFLHNRSFGEFMEPLSQSLVSLDRTKAIKLTPPSLFCRGTFPKDHGQA